LPSSRLSSRPRRCSLLTVTIEAPKPQHRPEPIPAKKLTGPSQMASPPVDQALRSLFPPTQVTQSSLCRAPPLSTPCIPHDIAAAL
jgi:hypothetical protein